MPGIAGSLVGSGTLVVVVVVVEVVGRVVVLLVVVVVVVVGSGLPVTVPLTQYTGFNALRSSTERPQLLANSHTYLQSTDWW